MHIRKLEIAGFKSFVDRTVIHFDHDVIAVVGPNGCGKSNIVDAIRWCMGEQSAKHLRGRAMEDVIFNGSESRNPHGFAEVTLTFDNTSAEHASILPPELQQYSEIAVTRRLFRDGTSEYLINKAPVRLRDVTELFLGTGVGTKAYSIVEQGRIGQIVSSRPEDRRLYIEEAAGITKYKQRRRQAERKMELTRQNLLRVSDIVSEIDRTRSSLKRQAAKAERYVKYRSELEELLLHQSAHRLLELIVVERVERSALDAGCTRAERARERLGAEDEALGAARQEAAAVEARTEAASQAAFRADNDVAALQAEVARSRDLLDHLKDRLSAAETEKASVAARLEQARAERGHLQSHLAALEEDAGAREADAELEEQALVELRRAEADANGAAQRARQDLAEATTGSAASQARLDALAQSVTESRVRRDRLLGERDALSEEIASFEAEATALRRSVAEHAEGRRLSAAELDALQQELDALRPRVLEAERAVDTAKNELGLRQSRLRALEDLHRRLEGVGSGVRALLSRADPEVVGMVADRLEVPEELTAAFAGLLGERLQCVVVSDLDRGLELLEALRTEERGRATIASARPAYVAGAPRTPPEGENVVGYLTDSVRRAPEDEALVRSLIGNTVVCRTAKDALAYARRNAGATAVALDGTVATADGLVSGGSRDDVAAAMVEQKREMRALASEVDQLQDRARTLTERHRQLRARMTDVGTSLDRARQGAHETEIAHVTAEKDLSRILGETDRAAARRRALEAELEELGRSLEQTAQEEKLSREQLDALQSRVEHARHALAKAEEEATARKERVDARASLVTERKVRLAQVREQIEAARSAFDKTLAAIAELEQRLAQIDSEEREASRSFGETAARIVVTREKLGEAEVRAREIHGEHEEVRGQLDRLRGALAERENVLKELRNELMEAEDQVRGQELKLQKLELDREHLLENVRERFRGLDLHRVVGVYHARPAPDAEHRRRIDELVKLIDRMGPVNLDAQAEYEDAEKRYTELSEQLTDIEKALADLEQAIKHMNRESRRRFREAFTSINELFKKTFVELFCGGRAELVLTNPEDLLETGVDIIAQPPGKKLGNIELMSGGEKALTATSLIFAIFRHRPSPFCVLDEVDAPLDEANVRRYNEAIRAMTDRSQFILITHIKATMQSVDVLYGVTMGEPGVSRLVSVKVNEAAQSRSVRSTSEVPAPEASTQVA